MEDIRQYQPTLVYLFGKEVSDYVIKHSNAEKLSETEYRIGNTVFILVAHPSYIAVYKRDKAKDYMKSIITRISGC